MNEYKGKQVLVTGGLGFIGSNLARKLVELGAEVTIVDNLIPEGGGNLFNIIGIKEKVRVYPGDIRDDWKMKHVILHKDYIFNLAGQTCHTDSMTAPFTDLDVNVHAQLMLLELCRKYNPGVKIVYASTRQLYGRPEYLPVDEAHPVRPVDINGVNKWAGEQYHLLYNNVYGIRSCVLRLTNTYGQGMRIKDAKQMFLGIWIRCLLEDQPFEIWEGHHLRDFNYVDDVVSAFLVAGISEQANGQVYNLGGTEPISLYCLGKLLIDVYGSGEFVAKMIPDERKKIDIGNCYLDSNKIQRELGRVPEVSLSVGLERTVDYYKKNWEKYV